MWTSYRLSGEDIFFPIFSSSHPPPPAPVTHSFISLSPSLPLPHLGPPPPPFFKSPLPITFSPFLLPYMPKICSIVWHSIKKKNIHENSDISHPPRRSHCPFRIILFMRMFVRHANYRLRICNQCISKRIAVIFTAHTLWRATFCLKYELTSKKKKSPFFSLLSPSSPSLSLSLFFFLLVTRQGGVCPPPPVGTLLGTINDKWMANPENDSP